MTSTVQVAGRTELPPEVVNKRVCLPPIARTGEPPGGGWRGRARGLRGRKCRGLQEIGQSCTDGKVQLLFFCMHLTSQGRTPVKSLSLIQQ